MICCRSPGREGWPHRRRTSKFEMGLSVEVNHAQSNKHFFSPLNYWLGALDPNSRGEQGGKETGGGSWGSCSRWCQWGISEKVTLWLVFPTNCLNSILLRDIASKRMWQTTTKQVSCPTSVPFLLNNSFLSFDGMIFFFFFGDHINFFFNFILFLNFTILY